MQAILPSTTEQKDVIVLVGPHKGIGSEVLKKIMDDLYRGKLDECEVRLTMREVEGRDSMKTIEECINHLLPSFEAKREENTAETHRAGMLRLRECLEQSRHGLHNLDDAESVAAIFKDATTTMLPIGVPRKPSQDREELAAINAGIYADYGTALGRCGNEGDNFICGNPVSLNVSLMQEHYNEARAQQGLEPREYAVMGMGSGLDTSRFHIVLSRLLSDTSHAQITSADISGEVFGPHTDQMVFNWSNVQIKGESLESFYREHNVSPVQQDAIKREAEENTKKFGASVNEGIGHSDTHSAAGNMWRIAKARRNAEPTSHLITVMHEGYTYGMPVTLGKNHIVPAIDALPMSPTTRDHLDVSVGSIQKTQDSYAKRLRAQQELPFPEPQINTPEEKTKYILGKANLVRHYPANDDAMSPQVELIFNAQKMLDYRDMANALSEHFTLGEGNVTLSSGDYTDKITLTLSEEKCKKLQELQATAREASRETARAVGSAAR